MLELPGEDASRIEDVEAIQTDWNFTSEELEAKVWVAEESAAQSVFCQAAHPQALCQRARGGRRRGRR
eukprot:2579906-Pyramimonas_sp.AAC.1